MTVTKGSIFDDMPEVQPQSINWGKVGDIVFGTKVAQRDNVMTKFGENSIFSVKVDGGFFHDKEGVKVELTPGDTWDIWGRNDIFDAQMKRMQIGQQFKLKFTDSKPSTKGNAAKIIKVFTDGSMDKEWLEAGGVVAGE